jgi:hypothetical protein
MGSERQFGLTNITNKMPLVPLIRDTTTIKEYNKYDLTKLPHWFHREAIDFLAYRKKDGKTLYLHFGNVKPHTTRFITFGLDKNTLIVITSDNGNISKRNADLGLAYGKFATLNTSRVHRLRHGKGQTRYEGGARVSYLMRCLGVIPIGSVCNEIATGADLFTSSTELVGSKIPEDRIIDGKNILSLTDAR